MGREATSANMFSFPAVWNILGGAARVVRWRIASPRRRRCATGEDACAAIRRIQATASELSQPMTACRRLRLGTGSSSTKYWSKTPAISRSELVS
jgi:hypothetical protein